MANLGEITELVANKNCYLKVGSDQYIGIESIRPVSFLFNEVIFDTSGAQIPDMVGELDERVILTLKYTKPEYDAFQTAKTAADTGIMTSTTYVVETVDNAGTTATISMSGWPETVEGPIKQPSQKYLTMDIVLRIIGGFTLS